MTDSARLDPDAIESGLRALLVSQPRAEVTAIDVHGLFVPTPPTIDLLSRAGLDARSALDLVDSGHRVAVIAAWDRVRESGAAHLRVRLREGDDAALYFFDLRERHGVLIGVIVADGERGTHGAHTAVEIAPRVSLQRKNDGAIFTEVDEATTKMLGWRRDEMVGRGSLDFVHPEDHDRAIESWMDMLSNPGEKRRARLRYHRCDGAWMWLEVTNHNLLGDPHVRCVLTEVLDITDEMAAHEAVRAREHLLRRVAETVPIGLLQIDRHWNLLYANERLFALLGVPKRDEITLPFTNIVAEDRAALERDLASLIADGEDRDLEIAIKTRRRGDDRLCHVRLRALSEPDGGVGGAIVCVEDITERARSRAELERRATYDQLTGCLNRASVLHNLDCHIREASTVGVIFADLDGFKRVNDEYGHSAGDLVLVEAVRRIKECTRDVDTLGRLGGDEFLVVCPNAGDLSDVMLIAARIASNFSAPFSIGDAPVSLRASIGVAVADGSATSESLVANADAAMYVAKREGTGRPIAGEPCRP